MEMNSPPVSLEGNHQSPKDPDKELSPGLKFLKTWLIYRIPTLLAWVWLFLRFSGWTLPIELRLESYLPLPYLFCFVIFVITGHWTLAFGYPFYFVFSPLLVVIEPVAFIVRTFTTSSEESSKLIRGFVRVVTFLRSLKAIIILILLVISAWTATVFYVAPTNRPALALAAHVITYILFLQSFRWAANPYKPILLGLGLVSRVGESILRKIFVEPNLKKKMEERASAYQTCNLIISGLDRIHNPETRLTHGITSVTHGRLAAIFTGFFFFMYILVASSFTFSLFEIENGWGKIITGLGETPDYMTYFYFSFLCQATAIPDGIQPLGHAGKLWLIWMVMTGLLLLTGLITLFTSAAGVYSDTTLNEVDRLFAEMKSKVQNCQSELNTTPDPE